MTTWKPIERPAAPYYMPEGDIETFREMYEKDSWKDRITNARELLEEAYKEVKRTSKRAKEITLPDTFKEVLDQETGHKEGSKDKATFPQWLYFGVIGKANLIIHDTRTAEATLAYIDGEEITQEMNPPNVLGDVQYRIKGIEKACWPARVYVNTMNIDFFEKPEKLLSAWIEDSDTDKNKEAIEAFREEVTKHAFRQIVSEVAAETGDDEKQIADPAKRTPEQRARLIASMRKHIAAKQEAVWKSVLMQTYYYCRDVENKTKLRADTVESVLHFAVAYYYTLHPEKDFTEEADPNEARDGAEAAEIYNKMLAFVEHRKRGQNIYYAIFDFIDGNTKPEADKKEIKKRVTSTANTLEQYSKLEPYSPMLNNVSMNDLINTSQKQIMTDPYTGAGVARTNQTEIDFDNICNVKMNYQTKRTLDMLTIKLTGQITKKETDANKINKARDVSLTVQEYMENCELKDKTAAYKQLTDAIRTIYEASLKGKKTVYEKTGKKNKNGKPIYAEKKKNFETHILSAIEEDADAPIVKDGKIKVRFEYDLVEYLAHSPIMQYHKELFKINPKYNPHSYFIGRKLCLHHNMNKGKTNENRISVETLLASCPDLPSYEEIKGEARQLSKRIIDPIERDLDLLQAKGILSSWEYCRTGGEPIPQDQLEKRTYEIWSKWLIQFELADYPEEEIEAK